MKLIQIHWVLYQHILLPYKNRLPGGSFIVDMMNMIHLYVCGEPYWCCYISIFHLGVLCSNLETFWQPSMSQLLLLFVLNWLFQASPRLKFHLLYHNTVECHVFTGIFIISGESSSEVLSFIDFFTREQ